MGPIGESMAAEPEQLEPRICPAVRKFRSGVNEAGKSLATRVDRLLGRCCCMNWMNCGVRIDLCPLTATVERRRSPEMKKNVLSLRMGPPSPQEISLRLKLGMVPPDCFWK